MALNIIEYFGKSKKNTNCFLKDYESQEEMSQSNKE